MAPAELGSPIGSGARAEVYDRGDAVLKLYKAEAGKEPAFREAAILAVIETLELPAPIVRAVERHGERWGLVMSKERGIAFAESMNPRNASAHLVEMARLQALVHTKPGRHLPSQLLRMRANIAEAPQLGRRLRQRLLDGLGEQPFADRLCHGDFHPYNILGRASRAVIVDWPDASQGSPSADVCRSFVLMSAVDPELATRYVDVYTALVGSDPQRVQSWLPFVAAARLAEGVAAEDERLLALAEAV
jgi:aminoglycoside phosphotransferase (APT) family kinase protein